MNRSPSTLTPSRLARGLFAAALAAVVGATSLVAQAEPIAFTIINPSGNQSRIDLSAAGMLLGGELTVAAQHPAGQGLNGLGSLSTLYTGTIETNLTQQYLGLPGGGGAVAQNARGSLNQQLSISPGIGGTTGTDPANYGLKLTSPLDIDLPAIPIGEGGGEVDLGTLTGVNMNVALRDLTLGLGGGNLPFDVPSVLPQNFDASQVDISIAGTADVSLTATLAQDNAIAYFANLVILQTLASQFPELGLVINGVFSLTAPKIEIGLATTVAIPTTTVANSAAGNGTLALEGSNYRLTVPVDFSFIPDLGGLEELVEIDLGMAGQLVAEAPFQEVVVPEPSSVILALSAAAALGIVIRRRRRS